MLQQSEVTLKYLLVLVGMLSIAAGVLAFLVAKSAFHETIAATLFAGAFAALAGAGVIEAVHKLTKTLSDRPTPDFAADKVVKELETLRAEVKALRTDLDDRANEVRSS